MMEINNLETVAQPSSAFRLSIEGKWVAYGVLLVLALLLRAADIDLVPMTGSEATRALSAYHTVFPDAPGQAHPAESPLMFWAQVIGFSTFGTGEGAARIGGILGGLLLVMIPLMFENYLGIVRAFIVSLLLAVSPVAFIAARTSDPTIWGAVLGLLVVWAGLRFWQRRDEFSACLLASLFFALLFLTGTTGMLLGIIMLLGIAGTLWWVIWQAPLERDTPGDEVLVEFNAMLSRFPFQKATLIAIVVVLMIATGFMLYPAGLSSLTNSLTVITGFFNSYQLESPVQFALRTILVYEPLLLIIALVSLAFLLRATVSVIDRFMVVWLLSGTLLLFLYSGAQAGHALLLVLPMVWIASSLIDRMFSSEIVNSALGEYYVYSRNRQNTMNWLVALVVFCLLIMGGVHLQEVGRGLQSLPADGNLSVFLETRFAPFRASLTWLAITGMLLAVVYLLVGSYRGAYAAFQGFVLGFVLLLIVSSIGGGWNAAVVNAANPLEFWHTSTAGSDTYLLRQTLHEIARRDTRGFPEIPVTVVLGESAGLGDDGLIAWLLRDFENARFVPSLTDAQRDEIVLLEVLPEDPDLGGSYVGQRFVVRQHWSIDEQLRPVDWLSWFLQRRIAGDGVRMDPGILWLRIDVYDGVPVDDRPRG